MKPSYALEAKISAMLPTSFDVSVSVKNRKNWEVYVVISSTLGFTIYDIEFASSNWEALRDSVLDHFKKFAKFNFTSGGKLVVNTGTTWAHHIVNQCRHRGIKSKPITQGAYYPEVGVVLMDN
jgi:hypothetical protein